MTILFKTVVHTKLMYAAPVWLQEANQNSFKDFYARVCLKISGSTHYPPQSLTLIAIGLEPIAVSYNIICTKFMLKALTSDFNMRGLIYQLEENRSHPFFHHIELVKKYIQSKDSLATFTRTGSYRYISQVDPTMLRYNKDDINNFKAIIWAEHINNDISSKNAVSNLSDPIVLDQWLHKKLTVHKYLFPRSSKKNIDTKVLALIHGHDLSFNSFRYAIGVNPTPFCSTCLSEKDTNLHQLLQCPNYNCHYRNELASLPFSTVNLGLAVLLYADTVQISCFRILAQIIIKD